jgi:type IV pilus assembly protein PilV
LIEVLVSVLIVSLGVVSMAGLLAKSSQLAKGSEYRAIATMMAADMADRIKANASAASANKYDQTTAFTALTSAPAITKTCSSGSQCDGANLATLDQQQWNQTLYYGLPNGQGYVKFDSTDQAVDVWVAWTDPNSLSIGDSVKKEYDALDKSNCPSAYTSASPYPRCVYLRVAL